MSNRCNIETELIRSKAFNTLTGKAPQVLLLFHTRRIMEQTKGKKSRWFIKNNGKITFTYSEALKKYGFTDGTFKRAIYQLTEKGFIRINSVGGLFNTSNTYTLLDNWRHYGTDKFIPPEKPARRYKSVGFQQGNTHGKNSKKNKKKK